MQFGCLSSVGGPEGTHLSSLLNGAYSRLRRVRGGYVSSPRRASANPHPLMSDGCLGTPSGPPGASGGLRLRDDLAPRPGVSCGAIGLRTRMMRLCAGDEYINTAHRHIPAFLACDVTRATPLPRPLVRRAPVHPLAGSFPWRRVILLLQGHRHLAKHPCHCPPPKEGGANGGTGILFRTPRKRPQQHQTAPTTNNPDQVNESGLRPRVLYRTLYRCVFPIGMAI